MAKSLMTLDHTDISRRRALGIAAAAAGAALLPGADCLADETAAGQIVTVDGPVPPDRLEVALPHEHVLVDFVGADRVSKDRYRVDEVVRVVLPHLRRARESGCQTMFECTPAWLGRDALLLKRLAAESGVQLVTNTGYYGASQNKYLPAHALTETADRLAERWLAEWRDGIEGTGVRPGFIKIGVDAGPLSDVHRKLVQAAARTHLDSGLSIAAHTGDGLAALDQLQVLVEEGVSPSAWIWVHAQNEKNAELHFKAAGQGAWVEFDGISGESLQQHVALVASMKQHGLLDRILISQDAGWYWVGEPGGGKFRGYDTLLAQFLPALAQAGLTQAEQDRLTIGAPAEAFAVRIRKA